MVNRYFSIKPRLAVTDEATYLPNPTRGNDIEHDAGISHTVLRT
jgi:hypothetical protein